MLAWVRGPNANVHAIVHTRTRAKDVDGVIVFVKMTYCPTIDPEYFHPSPVANVPFNSPRCVSGRGASGTSSTTASTSGSSLPSFPGKNTHKHIKQHMGER